MAAQVELPADLAQDLVEVAAPRARGIETHSCEAITHGLGDAERFELLVGKRVDEGDTWYAGVDDLIERLGRCDRVAHDQDQRVRDGARRLRAQQFGARHHGYAIAASQVRGPLDHRGQRGVHPPCAEADHSLVGAGRLAAAGRAGGDAAGLADEA